MRFGGLIAAIVFAAIAAVVVLRMSGNSQQAPVSAPQAAQQTNSINVYVAAKPISAGTAITEDMVATQPWPEHLALEGFVVADGKTNVVGMVARGSFQQSEPLFRSKLANPNDPNFLSGELPKGQRVVTIAINETDGVAGFVFPGDHVDLIYTHDIDKWEYPPGASSADATNDGVRAQKTKQTVTETLLTNVKVLAVDQRSSSAGAVDKNGNLIIPRSASLMVSQSDAQRVRLASKTGTVSLALRALADKESADPLILTRPKDVSQSAGAADDALPITADGGVKIVRGAPGTQKEKESGDAGLARGAPQASGVVPGSVLGTVVNPALVGTP